VSEVLPDEDNVPGLPPVTTIDGTTKAVSGLGEAMAEMMRIIGPADVKAGAAAFGGLTTAEYFRGMGFGYLADYKAKPKPSSMRGIFGLGEQGGMFADLMSGRGPGQGPEGLSDLPFGLGGPKGWLLDMAKQTDEAASNADLVGTNLEVAGDEMQNLAGWASLFGSTMGDAVAGTKELGQVLKDSLSSAAKLAGMALIQAGQIPLGLVLIAGGAFVGSFDQGGTVPRTGLAMVHAGEEITPRGGGGSSVTIVQNIYGSILAEREVEGIALNAYEKYG